MEYHVRCILNALPTVWAGALMARNLLPAPCFLCTPVGSCDQLRQRLPPAPLTDAIQVAGPLA